MHGCVFVCARFLKILGQTVLNIGLILLARGTIPVNIHVKLHMKLQFVYVQNHRREFRLLLNLSNFISLYADNYEYTLSYLGNMFFGRILLLLASWYTFKDTNNLQVYPLLRKCQKIFQERFMNTIPTCCWCVIFPSLFMRFTLHIWSKSLFAHNVG